MYFFSYLEAVCCSMSSSNCFFLTCIQISQEAGQVFWYSHLFQNFQQFTVNHTVKGVGIVNKAEIDVFLDSLPFPMIQRGCKKSDRTELLTFIFIKPINSELSRLRTQSHHFTPNCKTFPCSCFHPGILTAPSINRLFSQ